MITPIDALAFVISMTGVGAVVAVPAAVARKVGQVQRERRMAISRNLTPLLVETDLPIDLSTPLGAIEAEPMTIDADYRDVILPEQEAKYSEWIAQARAAAVSIARAKGSVTSDDLWEACPPPAGVDPRVMAAAFHPRTTWELARYVKSRRRVNHGRTVAEWRLRDAA